MPKEWRSFFFSMEVEVPEGKDYPSYEELSKLVADLVVKKHTKKGFTIKDCTAETGWGIMLIEKQLNRDSGENSEHNSREPGKKDKGS
jgi:hypothetical protein